MDEKQRLCRDGDMLNTRVGGAVAKGRIMHGEILSYEAGGLQTKSQLYIGKSFMLAFFDEIFGKAT